MFRLFAFFMSSHNTALQSLHQWRLKGTREPCPLSDYCLPLLCFAYIRILIDWWSHPLSVIHSLAGITRTPAIKTVACVDVLWFHDSVIPQAYRHYGPLSAWRRAELTCNYLPWITTVEHTNKIGIRASSVLLRAWISLLSLHCIKDTVNTCLHG